MSYQEEPDKGEKAIAEARKGASVTDRIIKEATETLEVTRRWREDNHFTVKLREIFHGA